MAGAWATTNGNCWNKRLNEWAPAIMGWIGGRRARQKAERIVGEELRRLRWPEAELTRRRKGDRDKARLAARLRKETTMTLKWIAQRLAMGSWTNVSNCLTKHQMIKLSKVSTLYNRPRRA